MLSSGHPSPSSSNVRQAPPCGGFPHFMLKEIFEQPDAVRDALADRISYSSPDVELEGINMRDRELASLSRVTFVACGTSWHAALLGKLVFEEWARLPGEAEIASELRHRHPVRDDGGLAVPISQSGETLDTVMATRMLMEKNIRAVAVSNAFESSLARESDGVIYTRGGVETGVASTKSFTTQIAVLMLLGLKIARARGAIDNHFSTSLVEGLLSVPVLMKKTLEQSDAIRGIAGRLSDTGPFLYVGRGLHYPMALEGALKAKEVSYIHAEGHPAGEIKHGPIALVESGSPVVAVAPAGPTLPCVRRNIDDVRARGARVVAILTEGDEETRKAADEVIEVPRAPYWLHPFLVAIPLQLLAYHLAVLRGTDVDRPRHLTKIVTAD